MNDETQPGGTGEETPPGRSTAERGTPATSLGRRAFLRASGLGVGSVAVGGSLSGVLASCRSPGLRAPGRDRDVVVVGAGAFGGWTALRLREMGARVTLVDLYGAGNSRSTSGDETRGVRSSYPGREIWTTWASRAIDAWEDFDEEWAPRLGGRLFFRTGDVILRDSAEGFIDEVRETWEGTGGEHEVLGVDEVAYRWPQIGLEGIGAALYERRAGVVRARAACQRVAEVFRRAGGEIRVARAAPGASQGGRLASVALEPEGILEADLFVFALGPWFPKAFPELMGERIRASTVGHVYYFGTPPGDPRFSHPELPSWNFPGVTGWPTLPPDHRGFRIRTGGRAQDDPDTSVRWIPESYLDQPRELLAERFPALADQPIVETRACHYESSATRDWIIDRHPDYENVWLAGGGSAEGFKFGPVLGGFIAGRVLGRDPHPELADRFRLEDEGEPAGREAPTPAREALG